MAAPHAELHELLGRTPLTEVVENAREQEIVTLEHNSTVAEALKTLAKHQILSAPVVVSPGLEDVESLSPSESAPQLLGWLDVKDILRALLAFLHESNPKLPSNMLALMTEMEKQGPAFAGKMLITVVGSEDRGLVYQADAGVSALAAVRDLFLGQGEGGRLVHRLAIFDAHGDITHVISQMEVLRFLLRQKEHLGPTASHTLEQLGLLSPSKVEHLVVLDPHTPTLLAFEKLAAAGVTGAPVLSPEGQIMANLSASDIRGIQPDHFGVLALPVAEFLAVRHGTSYLGYSQQSSSSAAHPFFASRARRTAGVRSPGPDASDADAAAEAAGEGGAGGGGAAAAAAAVAGELHRNGSRKARGGEEQPGGDDVPLITCAASATLLEVMTTMVDNRVHRVYVRQPGAKPHEVVGVVTPTDVLALVSGLGSWTRGKGGGAKRDAGSGDAEGGGGGGSCEGGEGGEVGGLKKHKSSGDE